MLKTLIVLFVVIISFNAHSKRLHIFTTETKEFGPILAVNLELIGQTPDLSTHSILTATGIKQISTVNEANFALNMPEENKISSENDHLNPNVREITTWFFRLFTILLAAFLLKGDRFLTREMLHNLKSG